MKKNIISFMILLIGIPLLSNEKLETVHVIVALCDNIHQGIHKVPAFMGNGKDADNNLYWGLSGGVKTYFKNSKEWKLVKTINTPDSIVIQRVIFKHKLHNAYLLADAYTGAEIKQAITDFLLSASDNFTVDIAIDSLKLRFGGKSDLIAFVGHDGLMEFEIEDSLSARSEQQEAIILACASKNFFKKYIEKTGAKPLLWTTHLMAPEAYTLKWAIDGWLLEETDEQILERAAQAYNKYQKCGIKGARNLFRTGY